jgi:hypothetical protein
MKRVLLWSTAVASAMISIGACTVFDGLSGPGADAAAESEASSPPDGGAEAGAGFISVDDAVKFCANAFKCPYLPSSTITSLGVPVDALHFSACVNWIAGPIPPDRVGAAIQAKWLKCAADAKTCTEAGSCMWWEIIAANDVRCMGQPDGGSLGICAEDGGAAYYCKDGIIAHCTNPGYAPGSTCLIGQDGDRRCAISKNCNMADSCMSSYEMYCGASSNLYQGIDCAITGYTCGLDPMSGFIQCLTNGQLKTCSASAITCDQNGTVVSVCDGAQVNEFKCTSLAGTCDPTGATPRCKVPNETCSPYDPDRDQCTGTSISLCVGGQKSTYDCAKVGLTCKPGMGAVSAHCG